MSDVLKSFNHAPLRKAHWLTCGRKKSYISSDCL